MSDTSTTPKKRKVTEPDSQDGCFEGVLQSSSSGNPCETSGPNTPRSKEAVKFNPFDVQALKRARKTLKTPVPAAPSSAPVEFSVSSLKAGDKFLGKPLVLRVTALVPFEPKNGDGVTTNFKFYGMDSTGEIGVIYFKWDKQKFLDVVKVGSVITLANFCVLESAMNKTQVLDTNLGIKMFESSEILPHQGIVADIPFTFKTVSSVRTLSRNTIIDLLVVVAKNWGMRQFPKTRMRMLTLVDRSGCCPLTLYGCQADIFGDASEVVLAIRNAAVTEYENEPCVSGWNFTGIWINPDTEEARDLLAFYNEEKERTERLLQECESDDDE